MKDINKVKVTVKDSILVYDNNKSDLTSLMYSLYDVDELHGITIGSEDIDSTIRISYRHEDDTYFAKTISLEPYGRIVWLDINIGTGVIKVRDEVYDRIDYFSKTDVDDTIRYIVGELIVAVDGIIDAICEHNKNKEAITQQKIDIETDYIIKL